MAKNESFYSLGTVNGIHANIRDISNILAFKKIFYRSCNVGAHGILSVHVSFITYAGDFSKGSHCLLCDFGKVIGKTIV